MTATKKLYLLDSYLVRCGSVLERIDPIPNTNHYKLILRETIFHPSGSGQVCDSGYIRGQTGEARVIDVVENNGVIEHIVEITKGEFKPDEAVICELDWDKRYKIMRTHTGEHILAKAFTKLFPGILISSAHNGEEKGHIVISVKKALTWNDIRNVEEIANKVVIRGEPVEITTYPNLATAKKHHRGGIREHVPNPNAPIRVVKIGDFDATACAGTHVKNTSEVLFIKVVSIEKKERNSYKIKYITGESAFAAVLDYSNILLQISRETSTKIEKITEKVADLLEQNKKYWRLVSKLSQSVIQYKLQDARDHPEKISDVLLYSIVLEDIDKSAVIKEVSNVKPEGKSIFIVGIRKPDPTLLIKKSDCVTLSLDTLLEKIKNIARTGGSVKNNLLIIGLIDPSQVDRLIKELRLILEESL